MIPACSESTTALDRMAEVLKKGSKRRERGDEEKERPLQLEKTTEEK